MDRQICLFTPPSCFLLDERVFLTLGILRVAAVLEQSGYQVEHLDLSGIENYPQVAREHVSKTSARIFGLTATSPQMPAATKVLKQIRETRPEAKVILGGPHITLVNAAWKKEKKNGIQGRATKAMVKLVEMFDVLVAGDGEDSIFQAISPDSPSIVDADDPKGPLFMTSSRYNEMPFPARHLVDVGSYKYSIDSVPALSMIAQLGCPFACAFCGGRESSMLRKIRTRNTETIVSEINHLYSRYGVRGIMFYDDELNVNKSMVQLMNAIHEVGKNLGVDFRLRGFIKSELFTDEQAEAMYRAGFRWILVGFESGSPRILENINKKATREDNTRCLQIARKHGLKVKALMSIGHPGESRDTIQDTEDWLLENKPDDFDATVITTYPGTPYFDNAVETSPGIWTYTAKNGDKLHACETDFNSDSSYYKGIPGEYKSFVFTDHLTPDELVRLRDELENRVRGKLGIPFNHGQPGIRFEASMGQMPGYILRTT